MFWLFDIPLPSFSYLIGLPLLMISSASAIIKLSLLLFLIHFYSRLWIKEIKSSLRPFTHILTLLLHELIIPGNS